MRILFVHQNFPGQFKHLAPTLADDPDNEVHVIAIRGQTQHPRIKLHNYRPSRSSSKDIHPWAADFETKTIRAEAVFRIALRLREQGFVPDVIIAHPGWGESLFLKEVWPDTRLGIYCEFFYPLTGADVGFDPEFPITDVGNSCRLRLKNLSNLMQFESADSGISPTEWQASTFPEPFRSHISVIHDGIDTEQLRPNPKVTLTINNDIKLTRADEIITFVNRNLEPYRGYHQFMRALPEILKRRPLARVMIVGGNDVSYGARPTDGRTWRKTFLDEVRSQIDMSRVHFVGTLEYASFIHLLQISRVHVYLTYPFVLSWSLIEAMSCGAAIVASDTQPVREVISHDENGRLVPFFDRKALVDEICGLLAVSEDRKRLGEAARKTAQERYDLRKHCLPRQIEWVRQLAAGHTSALRDHGAALH